MNFNIYINGVGGQGIGLLSSVLGEALIKAGYKVIGADTHGLAQRHGSVSSHIKVGENAFYPLVDKNEANLVISLERLEALRAAEEFLAPNGILIFYDSVYQPALTRIGQKKYPDIQDLERIINIKKARMHKVFIENLKDYRKQNIAVLGKLVSLKLFDNLNPDLIRELLSDYLKYDKEENLKIYDFMLKN